MPANVPPLQSGIVSAVEPQETIVSVVQNPADIVSVVGQTYSGGGGGGSGVQTIELAAPLNQALQITGTSTIPQIGIIMPGDSTQYLSRAGTWTVPPGSAASSVLSGTVNPTTPPTNASALYINTTTRKLWEWGVGSSSWALNTLSLDDLDDVAISDQPQTTWLKLISGEVTFFGQASVGGQNRWTINAFITATTAALLTPNAIVSPTNNGSQFVVLSTTLVSGTTSTYQIAFSSPTVATAATWNGQIGRIGADLWLAQTTQLVDGEYVAWNATSMKWEARSLPSFSTNRISNGTSNVTIAAANGPITMEVNGTQNVVQVSDVAGGLLTVADKVVAPNLTATTSLIATSASITNLSVTGTNATANFSAATNVNLGAVGNVKSSGGTSGQFLKTDGAGNLSFDNTSFFATSTFAPLTPGSALSRVVNNGDGTIYLNNFQTQNLKVGSQVSIGTTTPLPAQIYTLSSVSFNGAETVCVLTPVISGGPYASGTPVYGSNLITDYNTIKFNGTGVTASLANKLLTVNVSGGGSSALTGLTDVQVTEPSFSQIGSLTVTIVDAVAKGITLSGTPTGITVGDWLRGGTSLPGMVAAIQVISILNNSLEFNIDPSTFFAVGNNVYKLPATIHNNTLTFDNSVNKWIAKSTIGQQALDQICWIDRNAVLYATNVSIPIINRAITTNVSALMNDWTFDVATLDGVTSGSAIVLTDDFGRVASGTYLSAAAAGGSFAVLTDVLFDRLAGGGFALNTAYFVNVRQGQPAVQPLAQRVSSFLPRYDQAYLCTHNSDDTNFWGYLLEGANESGLANVNFTTAFGNDNYVTGIGFTWNSGSVPTGLASGSSVMIFDTRGRFSISNAVISLVTGNWFLEGEFNCTYGTTIPIGTYTILINGVEEEGFTLNGIDHAATLVAGTGIGLSITGSDLTITNTGSGSGIASSNFTSFVTELYGDRISGTGGTTQFIETGGGVLNFGFGVYEDGGDNEGGYIGSTKYIGTSGDPATSWYNYGMRFPVATTYTDVEVAVDLPSFSFSFTMQSTPPDQTSWFIDPLLFSKASSSAGSPPLLNANLFPGFALGQPGSDDQQMNALVYPTFTVTGSGTSYTATVGASRWVGIANNYMHTDTATPYAFFLRFGHETINLTAFSNVQITSGSGGVRALVALPGVGGATPSLQQVLTVGNTTGGQNIALTGASKLTGAVTNLGITGGLAGQFLSTDGSGNQSWAAAGGGSLSVWSETGYHVGSGSTVVSTIKVTATGKTLAQVNTDFPAGAIITASFATAPAYTQLTVALGGAVDLGSNNYQIPLTASPPAQFAGSGVARLFTNVSPLVFGDGLIRDQYNRYSANPDNSTVVFNSNGQLSVPNAVLNWWDYIGGSKVNGTATIATGKVFTALYNNGTVYRYVTTTKTPSGYPTTDGFYSTWDGTNVPTGVLATR